MTPDEVLALSMGDRKPGTVRDYLVSLLSTLWRQGDGFSAKRPFGYTDWQWIVHEVLVEAGAVPGVLDEDGHVEDGDISAADALMEQAIRHLAG